jgi:phosphoribosyl 1,2-cyclic phosphodiesterase
MNDGQANADIDMTDAPIQLKTLASGSSGNATFLRFGDTRLLVDAGISYRRIRMGLESMNESIDALDALIVTHEHGDHIKGVDLLRKRHPQLTVYATAGTAEACRESGKWSLSVDTIEAQRGFWLGQVHVLPFRTSHDARESVGFRFEAPGFTLGFATDLGRPTGEVVEGLSGCRAVVVEANYDEQMLRQGPYPAFLKRRIAGSGGHLSNEQARRLLDEVAGPELQSVVLGHLSEKNNSPQRAVAAARRGVGERADVQIIAAHRKQPGPTLSFEPRDTVSVPRQVELPLA